MSYVIVTGYCGNQRELLESWHENTLRYASPKRIFIVNGGGEPFAIGDCQWINLSENLGHHQNSTTKYCGWTMSFLLGCMLAYHEKADLIYKEQDCFAFGPWVAQMYADLGDKQVVLGKRNTAPECIGTRATSLFLIKHDFLLDFMISYMMFEASDRELLLERKFDALMQRNPNLIGELSFGYDRSAPAGFEYINDRVFYVQQLKQRDFAELRARGLLATTKQQPAADAGGAFNRLKQCKRGLMLYNRNDMYVGKSLEKYGEFSEGEVEMFAKIVRPNDVVIEVGANIGAHTVFLAKAVEPMGGVIAFEPQRLMFQLLSANMALNSRLNAFCMNAAVGDRAGTIQVPELDPNKICNFGGVRLDEGAAGWPVPLTRLDDLSLASCRLIKIDVEGMESSVLRGGRQMIARFRPILFVENDRPERSAELVALVRELGYRPFWHRTPLFNPKNFSGDRENVFPDISSTNMLCLPAESAEMSLAAGLDAM